MYSRLSINLVPTYKDFGAIQLSPVTLPIGNYSSKGTSIIRIGTRSLDFAYKPIFAKFRFFNRPENLRNRDYSLNFLLEDLC